MTLEERGLPSPKCPMTEERIGRLGGVGFEWDPNRDVWDRRLDELREYREVNGDCNVPQVYRVLLQKKHDCSHRSS